jgi:hypothetical protein
MQHQSRPYAWIARETGLGTEGQVTSEKMLIADGTVSSDVTSRRKMTSMARDRSPRSNRVQVHQTTNAGRCQQKNGGGGFRDGGKLLGEETT